MTKEKSDMKIVVIGGTGLIGSKVIVRLPSVRFQPVAAEDVASTVAKVAIGSPLNGIVELAGPEQLRLDDFIRRALSARNDPREVIADPHARYFGTELKEYSLVPLKDALLGEIRFEDWLTRPENQTPATKTLPKGKGATGA